QPVVGEDGLDDRVRAAVTVARVDTMLRARRADNAGRRAVGGQMGGLPLEARPQLDVVRAAVAGDRLVELEPHAEGCRGRVEAVEVPEEAGEGRAETRGPKLGHG